MVVNVHFLQFLVLLNACSLRASRLLLSLYALHLGAQPLTIGLLIATVSAVPAALSWPAGRLADQFGSRWLLVIGAVVSAAGLLLPLWISGMAVVFVTSALCGVSVSIYAVSLQNLIGLVSSKEDRAQNFGNYSLMMSLSNFFGPLVAGVAIDHAGYGAAFVCVALLTLAPAPLVMLLGAGFPQGSRDKERGAGGSVLEMLSAPGVRRMLAISSLQQAGQDLFQFYMPIYGHSVGLSAVSIAAILAANSAASFGVRIYLRRLIAWLNEERILTYAFFLGAASFMLLPFFQNALALGAIAFVFGLGSACAQPIVTMLTFSRSEAGRSGENLGLRMTVNQLTRVVGPVAFGSIASAFGLHPVFWINAMMLASGGLLSRTGIIDKRGENK